MYAYQFLDIFSKILKNMGGLRNVSRYRIKHKIKVSFSKRRVYFNFSKDCHKDIGFPGMVNQDK